MPTFPRQNSQYQQAGQAFEGMGGALSNTLMNLAQLRYQQQGQQQSRALQERDFQLRQGESQSNIKVNDAQISRLMAQQLYEQEQKQKMQRQRSVARSFGSGMETYNRASMGGVGSGVIDPIAMQSILTGQAAELSAGGDENMPKAMAQLMALNDPRARHMLALGYTPDQNAPPGSMIFDPITGKVTDRGIMNLSPDASAFQPNTIPGEPGTIVGQGLNRPTNDINSMARALASNVAFVNTVFPRSPYSSEEDSPERKAALSGASAIAKLLNDSISKKTSSPSSIVDTQNEVPIEEARLEAMRVLQQHPKDAEKIRQRFKELYGEDMLQPQPEIPFRQMPGQAVQRTNDFQGY